MKRFFALSLSTLLASLSLVTASCLASPLQENIDAIDITLSDEIVDHINEIHASITNPAL